MDTASAGIHCGYLVPLHTKAADKPMRSQTKAAGGRWNPEKQLRFVKPVPSGYECQGANTGYMVRSQAHLWKSIYM